MPALAPGLKTVFECAEGQEVVITIEYICATDVDSDDSKLTYLIARQPYHGVVLKNGVVVDRFFQEDIEARIISYKHTGTKTSPSLYLFVLGKIFHLLLSIINKTYLDLFRICKILVYT